MPTKKKRVARPKKATKASSRKRSTAARKTATVPRTMSPEDAYGQAMMAGRRMPHLEKFILRSPAWVCRYAENVLKKGWEQGEAAVLKDPWAIVTWNDRIRKNRRWPEGEKALIKAKDAAAACTYAVEARAGERWPELEKLLRACLDDPDAPQWLYDYARLVLKGPLPADLDKRMQLWAFKKPQVEEAVQYQNEKATFATMKPPTREAHS